jgi:hypothetical protein
LIVSNERFHPVCGSGYEKLPDDNPQQQKHAVMGRVDFPDDGEHDIHDGKEGKRLEQRPHIAEKIAVVAQLEGGPSECVKQCPEVAELVILRVGCVFFQNF